MELTKPVNFVERQNQLAQLLKALVYPARIAILDHLLRARSLLDLPFSSCNDPETLWRPSWSAQTKFQYLRAAQKGIDILVLLVSFFKNLV
jgi:hypothetical protein